MENKKRLLANKIVMGTFMLAFFIVFFLILDNERAKRIERNIVNFQKEYQQYIDSGLDKKTLSMLAADNFFASNRLNEYYNNLKNKTFKRYEKEYLDELYSFNFLKMENTNNFMAENKLNYQHLVEQNNELISKLEIRSNVGYLTNLKENNERLIVIANKELGNDALVIQEFLRAQKNIGTQITLLNDCFKEQKFVKWHYNREISQNYCEKLALGNCLELYNSDSETFISFTLNNPKKTSIKNLAYEYVSYHADDYRIHNLDLYQKNSGNNRIYIEVYELEIFNRKIYKYNISVIDKGYQLSCKLPSTS